VLFYLIELEFAFLGFFDCLFAFFIQDSSQMDCCFVVLDQRSFPGLAADNLLLLLFYIL
jgi:hypothetical protein